MIDQLITGYLNVHLLSSGIVWKWSLVTNQALLPAERALIFKLIGVDRVADFDVTSMMLNQTHWNCIAFFSGLGRIDF